MSLVVAIRNEADADAGEITAVTAAAFETLEISSHTEQFIIAAPRAAGSRAPRGATGVLFRLVVRRTDSAGYGHFPRCVQGD